MINPSIEAMAVEHLPDVLGIEQQVTASPWSQQLFLDSIENQHSFVLLDKGEVLGYLVFSIVAGQSELFNIAVSPQMQGKGLGRQLMQFYLSRLDSDIDECFLEVRRSNQPARQLYQKLGYAETGCRKGYYTMADGNREDALLMALSPQAYKLQEVGSE